MPECYSTFDRQVLSRLFISTGELRYEPVKAIDAWVVIDRAHGGVVRAFDRSLPDPEWMARTYAADRNQEAFQR